MSNEQLLTAPIHGNQKPARNNLPTSGVILRLPQSNQLSPVYRLSPLLRRWTAATFLVAFLGVFAGQCFCAVGVGCPRPTAGPAQAMPACCAAGQPCGMMMGKHSSKPASPDKGCQSHATAFFASLAGPPAVSLAAPAPLWLSTPPVFDYTFARFTAWEPAQPVALVPPRQLRPKIPDIRVFIQSLTV